MFRRFGADELADGLDKIGRLLEPPIHAGESHVGHFVHLTQRFHHALANGHARHFAIVFVGDFVHDFFHQVLDDLWAYGTFLTGLAHTREEFFLGEFLAPSIPFDDHQTLVLDLFVGGETVAAIEAFAPPTDDRALARRT